MSAKPYHIDLPAPGGGTSSFFVLDVPHQVSSELPPKERRKLIRIMEELIQDLHSNNKNLQELIRLREDASTRAIFGGRIVAMDELRRLWKAKYLDQSNWTLCQLLRHPVPTRIAEAVGPITYIIENFKRINGRDKTDPAPTLFLAVALSRIPGEEERAIRTFTEALKALDEPLPVQANGVNKPFRNVVWARANMARMYRQMGRIKEAKEQEKLAREWIIKENYPVCSPREIRGLVVDDIGTGENIIDHPDVISALDKLQEVAPNISLVNPNFNNLGPMFIAHGVADPSKINIEELVQNYMHSR